MITTLEEQTVHERIILKLILQTLAGCMDWVDLALNTERGRTLVNAVMNLRVS